MTLPKVVEVLQEFPRPRVEFLEEAVREECEKEEIRSRIEPDMEIAITAGSRGIANIDAILHACFDREAYCGRNVVERCVNRLKQWRGIATRYEKRAVNYRAMVVIASLMIWVPS